MQGGSYANDGGQKLFPGANRCRQAPVKEKIIAVRPAINLRLAVTRHKHLFYPFLIFYGARRTRDDSTDACPPPTS